MADEHLPAAFALRRSPRYLDARRRLADHPQLLRCTEINAFRFLAKVRSDVEPARPSPPLCDRLPRRDFLAIGSLAMGGLALPQLLRAEQAAGVRSSHKSIIMIYLAGGRRRRTWSTSTGRPRRNPRRVQADRHQRAWHPDFGVDALRGRHDGQVRHPAKRGGLGRAPCIVPVRPPGICSAGNLKEVSRRSLGPVASARRSIRRFGGRRSVDAHAAPAVQPAGAGFLGTAHAPFKPSGEALADMTLNDVVWIGCPTARSCWAAWTTSPPRRSPAVPAIAGRTDRTGGWAS